MASEDAIPDASETRAPVLIGGVVFLLTVSALMVGLRILSRGLLKQFALDDATSIAAWATIMGCGVSQVAMTKYGLGRHMNTLSPEEIVLYLRCFWLSVMFYTYSLFFIKMTFLLNYYRLLLVSKMRSVCIAAIVIIVLWGVSQGILVFVLCIPLQAWWDHSIDATCITYKHQVRWWYVNGAFNIVSDLMIIILPLPDLWKLHLPRSQKVYLMGIFCVGFLIVGISIMRIQWLHPEADITWWNVDPALWSLAEITAGIACACLPFLKPLTVRVKSFVVRTSTPLSKLRLRSKSTKSDMESYTTASEVQGELSRDRNTLSSVDSDQTVVNVISV
ncbi:hypothetical protein EDB81DRAFT_695717 [Dactylonectria macrodidyma]|uniref:Rhodopsin domain-containing protein n=1 Tax=Dactylonectria macrodidyma TaxID=307937 RepID=A0A9P9E873_9HYPO|nr:hypothetical protein EDB81DRAFT_695717 [Dactylonectria macrodidyma]